jgi:hypothetical protein
MGAKAAAKERVIVQAADVAANVPAGIKVSCHFVAHCASALNMALLNHHTF